MTTRAGTVIEQPRHLAQLQARLRNQAKGLGRESNVVERLVANVIVGQLLPPGVIKGGTALKVRLGEVATRFSRDLDAARAADVELESYLDTLGDNLANGWHGFTGTLRPARPTKAPPTVPTDYVMKPFKVAVAYRGSEWLTVDLELGRDEVGSTAAPDFVIAADVVELFEAVGLPTPDALPLLPVHHQIAQKIHACTSVGVDGANERAHDLVDLQIVVAKEQPDLGLTGATARRLFAARRAQAWPRTVVVLDGWAAIYDKEAAGLAVKPSVEEAVSWLNELITTMVEASSTGLKST